MSCRGCPVDNARHVLHARSRRSIVKWKEIMPLVRISVFHEMAAERRLRIAAAVYDAMRLTLGIPEGDRFIVLSAHLQDELIVDPNFMQMGRTSDFVLVHPTLRRGRSIETKQSFYEEAARLLEISANIAPDNIMVVLTENELADWSFGRGEAQYLLNPPDGTQTTKASRSDAKQSELRKSISAQKGDQS